MRSKILQQLLDETPKDVAIFVEKYGNLVIRIHEILEEKGLSQNGLAKNLGKKPSEISKWLNGEHNLTLRTIAKLEAELGEPLLVVPQHKKFETASNNAINFTVEQSPKINYPNDISFITINKSTSNSIVASAA